MRVNKRLAFPLVCVRNDENIRTSLSYYNHLVYCEDIKISCYSSDFLFFSERFF